MAISSRVSGSHELERVAELLLQQPDLSPAISGRSAPEHAHLLVRQRRAPALSLAPAALILDVPRMVLQRPRSSAAAVTQATADPEPAELADRPQRLERQRVPAQAGPGAAGQGVDEQPSLELSAELAGEGLCGDGRAIRILAPSLASADELDEPDVLLDLRVRARPRARHCPATTLRSRAPSSRARRRDSHRHLNHRPPRATRTGF